MKLTDMSSSTRLAKITKLMVLAEERASSNALDGDDTDVASIEVVTRGLEPHDAFEVLSLAANIAEERSLCLRKQIDVVKA